MMNANFQDDLDLWSGIEGCTWEQGIRKATCLAVGQILIDSANGAIPGIGLIPGFSALHDYVDANEYGGAFDWPGDVPSERNDETYVDLHCRFWDEVQERADKFLKGNPVWADFGVKVEA